MLKEFVNNEMSSNEVDSMMEDFFKQKEEKDFRKKWNKILDDKKPENKKSDDKTEGIALIGIDQFFQTSLKVGTVVKAEEVPKSKKLLLLQVDVGEEVHRQVVAGIKEWYSADDMLDTQVCVVANLKPAKLMGLKSEGMLLAAKDEDGLCMIRPEKPKTAGTPIG